VREPAHAAALVAPLHDELSTVTLRCLALIVAMNGVSLTNLAIALGISMPYASRLTDRLVRGGYAERRRPDDGDRRIVSLVPTPKGIEADAQVRARLARPRGGFPPHHTEDTAA
jgi:DNA-binding MarR family transcriptional regulator